MLGSIFIILGFCIILFAIFLHFMTPKFNEGQPKIGIVGFLITVMVGFFIATANGAFFYAEPGMSYLVQYPWGVQNAVVTPGYKFKWFGNVIPFKKVLTVRFSSKVGGTSRSFTDRAEEPTTGQEPHIPVRFNDAVTADVGAAIRFRLPEDEKLFIKVAVDFRSINNLVTSSLKPVCKEVMRNSARMLAAQEYIAGKGGEFEEALQDQMENGIYILETIELRDTTNKAIITEEQRQIEGKAIVRYKVQVSTDSTGSMRRKVNPFKQYGITVAQTAIEYVEFEEKFRQMLGQQRDAAAEANVERQKAKKAEFETQRIVAEGNKEKARVRAEKEKQQVETLMEAETEKKQAQINLEKAQILLEENRKKAESIKVLADAEAYKKKAMMQADNALEIRINAIKEIHKNYAVMLGKQQKIVPDVVIGGGEKGKSGAATDLVNLLTAQTAKQLGLNPNDLTPTR